MSKPRALNPQTNQNSPEATSPQKTKSPSDPKFQPEATEAGAELPSGSRIFGQDDRWMHQTGTAIKTMKQGEKQNQNPAAKTEVPPATDLPVDGHLFLG